MIYRLILLTGLLVGISSVAEAGIGISVGAVYARPAPYYYAPYPGYWYRPRPVYVEPVYGYPPPVMVQPIYRPAAVYYAQPGYVAQPTYVPAQPGYAPAQPTAPSAPSATTAPEAPAENAPSLNEVPLVPEPRSKRPPPPPVPSNGSELGVQRASARSMEAAPARAPLPAPIAAPVRPALPPIKVAFKGKLPAGAVKPFTCTHGYTGVSFDIDVPAWANPIDIKSSGRHKLRLKYKSGEVEIEYKKDGSARVTYSF